MGSELAELKSVLRSLVVSSPAQVDVRSLLRDYRTMIGAPLPLHNYGYKDPLTFLKERCSDCFLFHGPPANPTLTLIVPDTLKHIDNFVQKQKTSSAAIKIKGKRRSVPEPVQKKEDIQDLIYKTFTSNQVTTQNINKQLAGRPPDCDNKINITSTKTNDMNGGSNDTSIKSSSPTTNHRDDVDDNKSEQSDPSCSIYRGFIKKVGQNKSSLNISSCSQSVDRECSSKLSSVESDSGRQTSSSRNSAKKAYLEELRNEIYEIIKDSEDGVWYNDIMRLYRERYGRELDAARAGLADLYGVVAGMGARLASRAGAGGVRLHRAGAAPAPAPAPPAPAPRAAPAPAPDPGDPLPGVPYEADVFPPDCVSFADSVPAPRVRDARPGDLWGVIVGEVYSPSHFWLIRLGRDHSVAMENMMDDMTEYYERGEGRARWLSRGATRVGQYCASVYQGDWHRALIVRLLDADKAKVRHVDYGTVEAVAVRALKPLPARWAALPAQALRARLAHVRPAARGRRWPHAAAARFLQLVRDTRLVAKVVAVDEQEDTLEVFLVNTTGAADVVISRELVAAGHADPRDDSALQAEECYLYPRFAALEAGAAPNFAEISCYLRDGIAVEYVDAYRRHVPSAAPAPPPPSPPPPSPPPPSPPPADEKRPAEVEWPALVTDVPGGGGWTGTPRLPAPRTRLAAEAAESGPRGPGPRAGAAPPGAVWVAGRGWLEPRLSVPEWEIYMTLSRVDPETAHYFLLKAMHRAFVPPPFPPPAFPPPAFPSPAFPSPAFPSPAYPPSSFPTPALPPGMPPPPGF